MVPDASATDGYVSKAMSGVVRRQLDRILEFSTLAVNGPGARKELLSWTERSDVNDQVKTLLLSLSIEERQFLNRVLKIEHEVLYSSKPRVAEDLLKAVREVVK